jgi:hypothetical protein
MRERNRDHAERKQDDVSRDHSGGFASERDGWTGLHIRQEGPELSANEASVSKTNLRRCCRIKMKGKPNENTDDVVCLRGHSHRDSDAGCAE